MNEEGRDKGEERGEDRGEKREEDGEGRGRGGQGRAFTPNSAFLIPLRPISGASWSLSAGVCGRVHAVAVKNARAASAGPGVPVESLGVCGTGLPALNSAAWEAEIHFSLAGGNARVGSPLYGTAPCFPSLPFQAPFPSRVVVEVEAIQTTV